MYFRLYQKKIFKELTLRLEIFTHIVPVPAVVYYAALAILTFSKRFTDFVIIVLILSAIIASILMLIMGVILRYFKIKKIFSIKDKNQLKYQLLQLSKFETILIGSRWSIGVIVAYIIIILSLYFSYKEQFPLDFVLLLIPFLGVPIFLAIIPLEMSSHYLITENITRKYIKKSILKDLEVPTDKIKINFFTKIFIFIVSLVGFPMIILVSLMSLTYYFGTQLTNPIIHFIILSVICLYPIFQTAYYLAKNFNEGINQIKESLSKISNGNFNAKSGILTYDELGMLAQFTNKIIMQLKNMYESIKTLNENLEQIVEIRTLELKNTLEEVQKLKQQQDGDYYLTSLLIEPFLQKKLEDSNINERFDYDFILKQKKDFNFKGKYKQIGGDFCSFRKIYLKNKPFLFFINADAMGKSIQGAGGVLILTSILQSALERNLLFEEEQDYLPELWLRYLFIEMQKTFESFQGSMMISLIMGLIDIETNSMYFINAEHPFPALIRNGKFRLIKEKHFLRKIGSTIVEGNLFVHTILLKQNDMFICGSDGKDDIIYEDKLNEDETLFYKLLEKNHHDPYKTYLYIMENTIIKDDLSLLWIKATNKNLLEKDYLYYKNLKEKIKKKYQEKNYQMVYHLLKKYIADIPLDSQMFFLYTNVCYNIGNYEEAKEVIEALRLRNPINPWYLYLSSKIYNKLKQRNKALKYYHKAVEYATEEQLKSKLKKLEIELKY
jgi:methyl-accepting chemotaxis protein